jgi:hypothetical protein
MAVSGFKWDGNNNLTVIMESLQQTIPQLIEAGQAIVEETVLQGQQDQITILENAVTKTGLARQEEGGQPGRDLSGHMIAEIGSDVTTSGNTVSGSWGWDNPEEYFLQQDDGFERIPAAHSLFGSFTANREDFYAKVLDLVSGK